MITNFLLFIIPSIGRCRNPIFMMVDFNNSIFVISNLGLFLNLNYVFNYHSRKTQRWPNMMISMKPQKIFQIWNFVARTKHKHRTILRLGWVERWVKKQIFTIYISWFFKTTISFFLKNSKIIKFGNMTMSAYFEIAQLLFIAETLHIEILQRY